jgi:hypothetical protein
VQSVVSHVPEALGWAFCAVCFGQTKHAKESTTPLERLERHVDNTSGSEPVVNGGDAAAAAAVTGGEGGKMETDCNAQRPLTALEFIQAITTVVDNDDDEEYDATVSHVVAPPRTTTTTATPSVTYIPLRIPGSASAADAADVLMRRFRGTATALTTATTVPKWQEFAKDMDTTAPTADYGTTVSSESNEDLWQTTVISSPMEFQMLDPPKPRTIQSFYPYKNPTASMSLTTTDRINRELAERNGEMEPVESESFESSALYDRPLSDLDSLVAPALVETMSATPLSELDGYTESPRESIFVDTAPAESQYWSANGAPLLEKELRSNLSHFDSFDFLESVEIHNRLPENNSFGPEQFATTADFALPLMPLFHEEQYLAGPPPTSPSYSERSYWPAVSPTSRAMSATPSESREAMSPSLQSNSPWKVHWDGSDTTPSKSTDATSPPRATSMWKVHWDGADSRGTTASTGSHHHYSDALQSVAEDSTWQSSAAAVVESVAWESPPSPSPSPPQKHTWGVSPGWNGNSNPLGSSYLSQISQPAAGEAQGDTLRPFSFDARAAPGREQGEEQVSTASTTPLASWALQPSRHDDIAPASAWRDNGDRLSAPSMQSEGFRESYQESTSRATSDQYSTTSTPLSSWKAPPSRNDYIASASMWSDTGTALSAPSSQRRESQELYLESTAVTTGEQFASLPAPSSGRDTTASASSWSDNGGFHELYLESTSSAIGEQYSTTSTPLASWTAPPLRNDAMASASTWSDTSTGLSALLSQSRGSHESYLESTAVTIGDGTSFPASLREPFSWDRNGRLAADFRSNRQPSDTVSFSSARSYGLSESSTESIVPDEVYQETTKRPAQERAKDSVSYSSWDSSSSWSANHNGLSTSSTQQTASYPERISATDSSEASAETSSSLPELPALIAFTEPVADMAPKAFSDEIYSEPDFLWAMDTPRTVGSGMASAVGSTFYQSTSTVGSLSNGSNQETISRMRLPPTSPSATQTPSLPESSWQSSENFSWALDSPVRRHGAPDVSQSYYNYGAAMQENSRPVIGRLGETVIGRLGEVSEDREWWTKTGSSDWNKARR